MRASFSSLRGRLARLVASMPPPSAPAEDPSPDDEAEFCSKLEAKLLAQTGPLHPEAVEFLRLREMIRRIEGLKRVSGRDAGAIDIKAELEAAAEGQAP